MLPMCLVEFRKLNRSLALALAVVAPALIATFMFFNLLRGTSPEPLDMWLMSGTAVWAFFMLPMTVTALTTLVAHMEHGPKSWDHLRALPLPRWHIYAAKTLVLLAVLSLMSVFVLVMTWAAVEAAALVEPALRPTGTPHLLEHAMVLAKMLAAALLLVAVQFWLALRFSSFVPGMAVGIGGTFFAVVATSARAGVFMPWQMPVNILANEPWRAETALALGGAGGVVALVVMIAHLSWREVP